MNHVVSIEKFWYSAQTIKCNWHFKKKKIASEAPGFKETYHFYTPFHLVRQSLFKVYLLILIKNCGLYRIRIKIYIRNFKASTVKCNNDKCSKHIVQVPVGTYLAVNVKIRVHHVLPWAEEPGRDGGRPWSFLRSKITLSTPWQDHIKNLDRRYRRNMSLKRFCRPTPMTECTKIVHWKIHR